MSMSSGRFSMRGYASQGRRAVGRALANGETASVVGGDMFDAAIWESSF